MTASLPCYEKMLTSFLLRLCLGLTVLVPSLAHAQSAGVLEIPGNGTTVSGIGVISGWKCQAAGEITVEFLNAAGERIVINEGRTSNPVPMLYGSERPDIRENGACLGNDHDNVGFVAIWNWGELDDGTYTAVAYDNDVEFDRNTFIVTTFGTDFLREAITQVSIPDFPTPGETTTFQWNEATQHLEAVSRDPACRETLTMNPGETCRGSIPLELDTSRLGEINTGFTFSVEAEGRGCISISGIPALNYCYSASLPDVLDDIEISVIRNADGSWTIDDFPLVNLGECVIDLTVKPGAKCSGSIDLPIGELDFAFSVEADGEACIEAEVDLDVPLVDGKEIDACFDTRKDFQKILDKIDDIIEIGAFAAKNADNSWTILDFL